MLLKDDCLSFVIAHLMPVCGCGSVSSAIILGVLDEQMKLQLSLPQRQRRLS
jgi:hypothetical protein